MTGVLLHFFLGTIAALGVFLTSTYLAGETRFSAPFGVLVIGLACAALSHSLSPWATPAIVFLYALGAALELRRDRWQGKTGLARE